MVAGKTKEPMTMSKQPMLFPVEWEEKTFKYQLLNGDVFSLRYWYDGENHIVAGTDLRESIGEEKRTFNKNVNVLGKKIPDTIGTSKAREIYHNSNVSFYNLSDAIKYVSKRYEPFQSTFIERGVNALVSLEDNDVVGILTALGKTVEDAENAVIDTATNNQLSARTKSRLRRNELTESISNHGGHGWIYPCVTDKTYVTTLGKNTKELRKEYDTKGTPRDKMSASDLNKVMEFELSTTNNIEASGAHGNEQINKIVDYTADCYTAMIEGAKNFFKQH